MSLDAALPELGLIFLLGLRHGVDPDHIAVIDNLTFQTVEARPGWAPWIGSLFSVGHSLSVAAVAITFSLVSKAVAWPAWFAPTVDWAATLLLILVGVLNLRALRRPDAFRPVGWRQGMVFRSLRETSHPLAVVLVGVLFGLVFDTATQAAAWGMAASPYGGVGGAMAISAAFAAGMVLTDTADSLIVARLLRGGGDASRIRRYRRGVGWLIVVMSFGMAAYAIATKLFAVEASGAVLSLIGLAMAIGVVKLLAFGRRARPC